MHVLMISLDVTMLTQAIGNSRIRHEAYGEQVGRISMVICNRQGKASLSTYESPRVVARPTESRSFFHYLIDGYRAGLRFHAEQHVDLITSQDPFLTALIGLALRRKTRAPLLIQINSPTVENRYFREESLRNRLLQKLARFTIRQADGIRVLSEEERQACIRQGVAPERVCIVPIPSDITGFVTPVPEAAITAWRNNLGIQPNTPIILWIGRPVYFKNLPMLLRAFARVHSQVPEARLVLAGDTTGTTIPEQIKQLGLSSSVLLPGNVAHPDLPALCQLSTIYAHPSIYEGLGIVMIEAGAAGLPVVASATDGAREIVVDGQTGIIVPLDDHNTMADALIKLLCDPALAREMGQHGRQRVQKIFDEKKVMARWLQMWRNLADRRNPCEF